MRMWILGAPDVEMAAIESILKKAGQQVSYAISKNGKRVHVGNAYQAIPPVEQFDEIYFVETDCKIEGVHIDHHRPGDVGYGRPPVEFFEASSIGQVLTELTRLGILFYSYKGWYISECIITLEEALFIAAADHCLAAAYRNECPGVDAEELMEWRIKSRAKHQGRSYQEVLLDVERARQILISAIDLRGQSIPELPEAACREGIPFLANVRDIDGREKVVLQAAHPDLIKRFMNGEIISGLVDYYGDPARGFAGGYYDNV